MRTFCLLVALVGVAAAAQEKTVFASDYNAAKISSLLASGNGQWTDWMNDDTPDGTGEYENVGRHHNFDAERQRPKMLCDNPVAMTYASVDGDDMDEIEECKNMAGIELSPPTGYKCRNSLQMYTDSTMSTLVQYSDQCKDFCDDNNLSRGGVACGGCPDVKVKYFCEGSADEFQSYMDNAKRDLEELLDMDKELKRVLEEEKREIKREQMSKRKEEALEKDETVSLLKELVRALAQKKQ